jgi:hypothetical protein
MRVDGGLRPPRRGTPQRWLHDHPRADLDRAYNRWAFLLAVPDADVAQIDQAENAYDKLYARALERAAIACRRESLSAVCRRARPICRGLRGPSRRRRGRPARRRTRRNRNASDSDGDGPHARRHTRELAGGSGRHGR